MNQVLETVREILDAHYDLGRLVSAEANTRGYINVTYVVTVAAGDAERRYILRRYRFGSVGTRIRFEHELMGELDRRGFDLAPVPVPTREGDTIIDGTALHPDGGMRPAYLAAFTFLEGDEPYTWDNPACTPTELAEVARVLAAYHRALFGWTPAASWRGPRLIELLPSLVGEWSELGGSSDPTVFETHFLERRPDLVAIARRLEAALPRETYDTLPHLAVHGDYHPGNLKYRNGTVVGLFDFDWANMDSRCFDVALALMYCCAVWDGEEDDGLDSGKVACFLEAYQRELAGSSLGPFAGVELDWLPDMIQAANFYVLSWTVGDYFMLRPDAEEYLRYLGLGTRLAAWLEAHRDDMAALVGTYG